MRIRRLHDTAILVFSPFFHVALIRLRPNWNRDRRKHIIYIHISMLFFLFCSSNLFQLGFYPCIHPFESAPNSFLQLLIHFFWNLSFQELNERLNRTQSAPTAAPFQVFQHVFHQFSIEAVLKGVGNWPKRKTWSLPDVTELNQKRKMCSFIHHGTENVHQCNRNPKFHLQSRRKLVLPDDGTTSLAI